MHVDDALRARPFMQIVNILCHQKEVPTSNQPCFETGQRSMRFVRFSGRALTGGVERHYIEGVEVKIFEPAKTIVDCFRYRNKIGLDIALEGLKEGLGRRRVTPDQIWRFAQHARVWSVMRPYVEAVVPDGA